MDFKILSRLASLLSKSFAEQFLTLLVKYKNISASEAASRLDLHIKTAQDFLEELYLLGYVKKEEVFEKKRPYFRYTLKKTGISIEYDLNLLYNNEEALSKLNMSIRERKNSGAIFSTAGNNQYLASVTFFSGEGRNKNERKVSLTSAQGKFLFYLPFPSADYLSINQILEKAELDDTNLPEILDIVELLISNKIIQPEN